jgi:hypothetical protein
MAFDGVTRRPLDGRGHPTQVTVVDVCRTPASGADDVVVVARPTGDVGMLAVRQVDALDEAAGEEEIQGPEDGRAPDADAAPSRIGDEVGRREVAVTPGLDEPEHRSPGSRGADRVGRRGGTRSGHPRMILSINRVVKAR